MDQVKTRKRCIAFWQTVVLLLLHQQQLTASASTTTTTTDVSKQILEESSSHHANPLLMEPTTGDTTDNNNRLQTKKTAPLERLVVATADGTLTCVSRSTGEVIWKQTPETNDFLRPMVSTTSQRNNNKQSNHKRKTTTVVPSLLDGKVYIGSDTSEVSANIKELVERTPFVDNMGRLFTSKQESSVISIHADTGEIAETGNPIIWIGRIDNTVSIASAGGTDTAQFRYSQLLSVQDMLLHDSPAWHEKLSHLHVGKPTLVSSSIISTPGGHVGFRDPHSKQIVWVRQFDTPVAFCLDTATGTSLDITLVSDVVLPNFSDKEYLGNELLRAYERDTTEETIFHALPSGELYAMPLGKQSEVNVAPTHHSSPHRIGTKQHDILCHPGSLYFPGCQKQQKHAAVIGDDGAIVPFYHPEYGYQYIPPDQFYTLNDFPPKRTKTRKLFKLFGSWIAPVVVLIFVSSFELGRRRKQQEEKRDALAKKTIIQVNEDCVLGHGGGGTMVYKGTLEGRQVAVKRMLKTYHASADREISLLIESDGHPNVVRYFLKEIRGDFVYLALELCDLSLHDLIGNIRSKLDRMQSEKERQKAADTLFAATKTILLQISMGVSHLHRLRIVHRDLKPANILLADTKQLKRKREASVCEIFELGEYIAKISDMGLGKQLVGHSSYGGGSFRNDSSLRGHSNGGQSSIVGVGPGSVGWQAPEVMALRVTSAENSVKSDGDCDAMVEASPLDISPNARTSRSVDIFSLGCIFYSTIIPGSHPFGDWYEREANIMHNRPRLEELETLSVEAHDLVKAMLDRSASARPTARQICEHPFFWSRERRLSFLCDFSDRLETDAGSTEAGPELAKLLVVERNAAMVVGTSWYQKLDPDLVNNVQRFRTYDASAVRDLLRLIRNKHHHFDELSDSLKMSIGNKTEGLMKYFDRNFPRLVIHCVKVCQELYSEDDTLLLKYCIAVPLIVPATSSLSKKYTDEQHSHLDANTCELPGDNKENTPIVLENDEASDGSPGDIVVIETELSPVPEEPPEPTSDILSEEETTNLVVWHGSTASNTLKCRGWSRTDLEWSNRLAECGRRRDKLLQKNGSDPKFRTRLCSHWDNSHGEFCPMRKKGKCIFAHGPVQLRVKEEKRNRWGKLVDENGDKAYDLDNRRHSGGEDTYGLACAARDRDTKQANKKGLKNGKTK